MLRSLRVCFVWMPDNVFKNVGLLIELCAFLKRKHTYTRSRAGATLSIAHDHLEAIQEETYEVPGGMAGAWLLSVPILAVILFAMYSIGLTCT